jgi:pSer/pThr/pTyr-binding forkhead associated (FHA) protein
MPDSPSHVFALLLVYAGEQTTVSAQTPFTIGRAPEMDLVLPYPFISRRQAEIRFDDSTGRLELISSGAACFVNGRGVERHALAAGDEIRFGSMEGPLLRLLGEATDTLFLRAALDRLEQPASTGVAELGKLAWKRRDG